MTDHKSTDFSQKGFRSTKSSWIWQAEWITISNWPNSFSINSDNCKISLLLFKSIWKGIPVACFFSMPSTVSCKLLLTSNPNWLTVVPFLRLLAAQIIISLGWAMPYAIPFPTPRLAPVTKIILLFVIFSGIGGFKWAMLLRQEIILQLEFVVHISS